MKSGAELFIIDNSDEHWKAYRYLHDWCDIARAFDIATGYFEIGSLLSLDGQWQKLNQIRILMGDEVSKRTRQAFEAVLAQITTRLDDSIEAAKEDDCTTTRLAQAALDPDRVSLPLVEGFARIGPVPDERIDGLAVQTHLRARKTKPVERIGVRLDIASKVGYNSHALLVGPTQRMHSERSFGRAIPFSKWC